MIYQINNQHLFYHIQPFKTLIFFLTFERKPSELGLVSSARSKSYAMQKTQPIRTFNAQ